MQNLKILNSKPVQTDFWGNGAVYHGYAGMPDCDGRVYSKELCELEAKRAADMRLKIARTFYGWWAWEPETKTWDWDNDRMRPFYNWLQRMKDANITVALNTGWCSPGDIDGTSWNRDCPFNVEGDWEQSKQNYADWVSETIYQLIELRGFTNIKIFVMFTEPNTGFRNYKAFGLWQEAVLAAHNTLVRDNRRHYIKMMGSNEGSGITSDMLKWLSENDEIKDIIDIYSSHCYQTCGPIGNKNIITGNGVVPMKLAGGRISRDVNLKQNTEYVCSADILFESDSQEKIGHVLVGVFDSKGEIDIYDETSDKPFDAASKGSVLKIDSNEISSEYRRFEFKFNSNEITNARIGVFYDIKSAGTLYLEQMILSEVDNCENIIKNGDFSDSYSGWRAMYCGGLYDAYFDWFGWCDHAMQYTLNKTKPFCFDEYNVIYDRDNSRVSHGAEIVTAAIAFMNCGAQSSLLRTAFDQLWPNKHTTNNDSFVDGDHRCGMMPLLTRTKVPHLSYYAFSLLSRYVTGEGTKVYKGIGKNSVHSTLSVSPKGDITIVVVNNKDKNDEFTIDFELPLNVKLFRHSFNPETCVPDEKAEIIGVDEILEVNNSLIDNISAFGVTVYTTMKD